MQCFGLFGLTGEHGPDPALPRLALEKVAAFPVALWRRVETLSDLEDVRRSQLTLAYELPAHSGGASLTLRTIGGPVRGDRVLTSIVLRLPGFMLRALGEAVLCDELRGGASVRAVAAPVRFVNRGDDPHELASLFRRVYEDLSTSSTAVGLRIQVLNESMRESSGPVP